MADRMSIDNKPNPPRQDDSDESANSSLEGEQKPPVIPQASVSQETQQPKRKGGRKPIYATSEERKQRNRQAQAAFRERRTEYIKQLEEAIRVHETSLCSLQNAHRSAAEECLMLRYKNSLLERILLEKGIDVQAELHAKTGSPHLGPTHVPKSLVQPPPIQHRAIINRHHQPRKSISGVVPKQEPSMTPLSAALPPQKPPVSPKHRASASSHSGSPINSASAFSPAPSDSVSNRGSAGGMAQQPTAGGRPPTRPSAMTAGHKARAQSVSSGAAYYSATNFHNPVDQLEQGYERKHELVDETDLAPYAGAFNGDSQQAMLLSPSPTAHGPQVIHPQLPTRPGQPFPSMTQLLDQGLDWDPFGLNASLQFPAHQPFQFDQANLR